MSSELENKTKKKLIADTFKKHFEHFGFKKTSIDDISKELKISKKTIYQFFSKKEEIFYFILRRIARQYVKKMQKRLEHLDTVSEKFEKLILLIFTETKKWLKKNDAFEFKYKYEIASMAFQDAYSELITKLIRQGIEKGEFKQVPVELSMKFIQGIISEAMKLLNANPHLDVKQEVVVAVLKLLN